MIAPHTFDLVVIGGGPAGCAAALSAYNAGVKNIAIIEKQMQNRHRIGEILLTQTVLEWKALGIEKEIFAAFKHYQWEQKFRAIYVHGKDRIPWNVQNNNPLADDEDELQHFPKEFVDENTKRVFTLMVKRHEFDYELRKICQRRGITILEGNVKDFHIVQPQSEKSYISKLKIELSSTEHQEAQEIILSPNQIIDASGQQAIIARKLGIRDLVGDTGLSSRYAYFKNVDFANAEQYGFAKKAANIIQHQNGWSWIAHLGGDITSIGIVGKNWEKPFFEKLKEIPEFEKFGLNKAIIVDHFGAEKPNHCFAHPDYRYRSNKIYGKNWVMAGDSAMFLDPLLSQGVTLAFTFGRFAGQTAAGIINEVTDETGYKNFERAYVHQIETLNKIVSLWYQNDFEFEKDWIDTAGKLNHVFGREISQNIETFRWISNLENIQFLLDHHSEKELIHKINDVNNIKLIHSFENDEYNIKK